VYSLYLNENPLKFGGISVRKDRTLFNIVGVPLDQSVTFRSGTRLAPTRIREVSANIEFYSFRSHVDFENILVYDMGDLCLIPGDLRASLERIESLARGVFNESRFTIFMGGEHLITYSIVKSLPQDTKVLIFDAHFDLRNEYLGSKLNHACVTRRIMEYVGPGNIMIVGVRAACEEEVNFARKKRISYIPSYIITRESLPEIIRRINKFLGNASTVYVSIDMDVIDPAYAPGVSNPEPEGITPRHLLDILFGILSSDIKGLDIVEVSPPYDFSDITSILAAKIIIESFSIMYTRIPRTNKIRSKRNNK